MQNVQQRQVAAPAAVVGALLDELAGPADRLWPSAPWPPLVLDAGLTPGSRGGHGPIRYTTTAVEPGRRVHFTFNRSSGLIGTHELVVSADGPKRCLLTHTTIARTHGRMVVLWPLVVRWLHEALLQDLLDNAERHATGREPANPARWSPWVRLLLKIRGRASARA